MKSNKVLEKALIKLYRLSLKKNRKNQPSQVKVWNYWISYAINANRIFLKLTNQLILKEVFNNYLIKITIYLNNIIRVKQNLYS